MDGWMDGGREGGRDGWMDGWVGGWMDGWMDGLLVFPERDREGLFGEKHCHQRLLSGGCL